MSRILEIACFDLQSAIAAQQAGADRIELCENYHSGGLTPSQALIRSARACTNLPLHVIIRPHARDFVYTAQELDDMKASVLFCKANKLDGVVFGVLNGKKEIDVSAVKELTSLARPMSVTFHRAIDETPDLMISTAALIALGVDRVLSSGGQPDALRGIHLLKAMQEAYGREIVVMPGGGLRSDGIRTMLETGCSEFHSSARSEKGELDTNEIRRLKEMITSH